MNNTPATAAMAIPAIAPPDNPLSSSLSEPRVAIGVMVGIVLLLGGGAVVTACLIMKRLLRPV
jgi:hypothetical protein